MVSLANLTKEKFIRSNQELTSLHQFILWLNSTHSIEEILTKGTEKIKQFMCADGCHIFLSSEFLSELKLETSAYDELNSPNSTISVPLFVNGKKCGLLIIKSERQDKYNSDDHKLMIILGSHLGLALENAKLFNKLRKESIKDSLTGAYNYRYLIESLNYFMNERDKLFSLILLDLDGFKKINDNYGHTVGDFILRKVTGIIKVNVRKDDIVIRKGGDEFVIILPGASEKEAYRSGNRIGEAISAYNFSTGRQKIKTSVSWGIVTKIGMDIDSIEEVIDVADMRLYGMKKLKTLRTS